MRFTINDECNFENLTKLKTTRFNKENAQVTHFAHKLKIANFTHFLRNNDWKHALVSTNDFVPENSKKFTSNIEVSSNDEEEYVDYLNVLVCFENLVNDDFKVIYRLSLLDGCGNVHFSKVNCNVARKLGRFSWENTVDLKYILNPENQVLNNNILTIFCEMVIVEDFEDIELNHMDLLDGSYYEQDQFHIVPVVRSYFNAKPKIIEALKHKWTIANVSYLFDDKTNWGVNQIHSEKFSSVLNDKIKFNLILCQNQENVGIYLRCFSEDELNVRFKLGLIENKISKIGQNIYARKQNAWGFENYISIQKLLDHQRGSILDEKLSLVCEIQILDENESQLESDLPKQIVSKGFSNARPKIVESLAHKWTIDNFGCLSSDSKDVNENIESEKFNGKSLKEKFQFQLSLVKSKCDYSIYLHCTSLEEEKIRFKLSILDENDEKCFNQVGVETFCSKQRSIKVISLSNSLEDLNRLLKNNILIIYCEIQVIEDLSKFKLENNEIIIKESKSYYNAKSQISGLLVHKWTIDNFRQLYNQNHRNKKIVSDKFPLNKDVQFQLSLYPNGKDQKHQNSVSLFLHHFSKEKVNLNVRFKFSILDENGANKTAKVRRRKFLGTNDYWGFVDFVSLSKLLNQSCGLLFGTKLIIHCKIQIFEDGNIKSAKIYKNLLKQLSETYFEVQPKLLEKELSSITDTKFSVSAASNSNKTNQLTKMALQKIYKSCDSIKFSKCAHRWTIQNLNMNDFLNSIKILMSEYFSSPNSTDIRFKLEIHIFGNKDSVSIYLKVDKKRNSKFSYRYNFSIIDANGKHTLLKDEHETNKWYITRINLDKNLTHDEFQSKYLDDYKNLTLHLKIISIEEFSAIKLSETEIDEYLEELYKLNLNEDEITYTLTNSIKEGKNKNEKSSDLIAEKTNTEKNSEKIERKKFNAQILIPKMHVSAETFPMLPSWWPSVKLNSIPSKTYSKMEVSKAIRQHSNSTNESVDKALPKIYSSYNSMKFDKCAHRWTIQNLNMKDFCILKSGYFSSSNSIDIRFQLEINISSIYDSVSLYLNVDKKSKSELLYRYHYSIIDEDGKEIVLKDYVDTSFTARTIYLNEKMTRDEFESIFLFKSNTLTLYLKIVSIEETSVTLSKTEIKVQLDELYKLDLNDDEVTCTVTDASKELEESAEKKTSALNTEKADSKTLVSQSSSLPSAKPNSNQPKTDSKTLASSSRSLPSAKPNFNQPEIDSKTFASTLSNSIQTVNKVQIGNQQIYRSYDSINFKNSSKFSHCWTIRNLNMDDFLDLSGNFESKYFSPLNSHEVKFQLEIILHAKSYKDSVYIYLNVDKKIQTQLLYRFNYSIIGADGKQTVLKDEHAFGGICIDSNMTHDEFQSIYLQNSNKLTLQLKIASIEKLSETKLSKTEIKEYLDELYMLDLNEDEITSTETNIKGKSEYEKPSSLNTENKNTEQVKESIQKNSGFPDAQLISTSTNESEDIGKQQIERSCNSLKFNKFAHRWTISNLNINEYFSVKVLKSYYFSPINSIEVKFQLVIETLIFNKNDDDETLLDNVSIYLTVDKKSNSKLSYRYNCSINDANGKEIVLEDYVDINSFTSRIYLNKLTNEFESMFLRQSNTLKLYLKIVSIEEMSEIAFSKREIKKHLDKLYKLDLNNNEVTCTVTDASKDVESTSGCILM